MIFFKNWNLLIYLFIQPPGGSSGGGTAGFVPATAPASISPQKPLYPNPKEREAAGSATNDVAKFLEEEKVPPPSYDSLSAGSLQVGIFDLFLCYL